jgi:hypothetical protein
MSRYKLHHRNSSKFKNIKIFLKQLQKKTIKTKIQKLKWILIPIFLCIVLGIIVIFLVNENSYLQIIIGYSITGFLTFFMAYLGWVLAHILIEKITVHNKKDDNSLLFYFKKFRKNNEQ